jgi:tetratricopeptide (TPR) repeat protein
MSKGRQKKRVAESTAQSRAAQRPTAGAVSSVSLPSGLKWKPALALTAVILLATAIVFWPVRHYEFVSFDDPDYVAKNPIVASIRAGHGLWPPLVKGYANNWIPLAWLSHWLDIQLFGMNAGWHHVVNLLMHLASTGLLLLVLFRVTGAIGRSAVVAGLFALHPLHVESVAWVAERKDVLSTLLTMLTLWSYVWYSSKPRLGRYLVVLSLFALGLMAKPMLVTLPFLLLLLDVWPLGRISISALSRQRAAVAPLAAEKIPLLLLTVISSIITYSVQRSSGAMVAAELLPVSRRIGNALVAYVTYIGKMIWPSKLAVLYPFRQAIPVWEVIGSAIILIAASVLAIRLARSYPYVFAGWFWYLGALVPVIGLVQVGNQALADRYTYVPLIGLFIIIAWSAGDLSKRLPLPRIALPVAACIVLVVCGVITRGQLSSWQNSLTLWQRAVAVTEDNAVAHSNLGVIYGDLGRTAEEVAEYTETLRLNPANVNAHINLGIVLANQGKLQDAIEHYLAALRVDRNRGDIHNALGAAYLEQGKIDDAIHEFEEAVRLRPDDARWRYNAGYAYEIKGDRSSAARQYQAALAINPSYAEARAALENLARSQPK